MPSTAGGLCSRCAEGERRKRGDLVPSGTNGWGLPEGHRWSPTRLGNPQAAGSLLESQ